MSTSPAGPPEGQPPTGQATHDFVHKVSHELRTPISTILGFGELLTLSELGAEQHEWAAMIVKAAREMTAFMDDLTDISRAQTRRLPLGTEAVGVREVIADALELVRPLAASHGVFLDPAPDTGDRVLADPRRLRQILINLLSNAVKYNHPAGKVSIAVSRQAGERVRISVTDTGRGIADYDLSELFAPFQRLDAAETGIEGAGLGLTLCRELIEAMDGTLGATSTPGHGSMFWAELPATEVTTSATYSPRPADDPASRPRAYRGSKTILYVEDMVDSLLLIEHVLRQRPSTTVIPAMLGAVALDLAAEHRPDLILLDLNLPDMPGEELLQRLKADPATQATPIVIISADINPERISHAQAAGAAGYLTKPISVHDFLAIMDRILGQPGTSGPGLPGQPQPAPVRWGRDAPREP
jgi:CheY-like chemotaxis protein